MHTPPAHSGPVLFPRWRQACRAIVVGGMFVAVVPACLAGPAVYYGPPRPGNPLVQGVVTQQFNQAWSANPAKVHTGVDIAASAGQNVYATAGGVVTRVGNLGTSPGGQSWGQYVVVRQPGGAANGYLHVNPGVSVGTQVVQGQIVGTVQRDHLHYNQCAQAAGCQSGAYPNATYQQPGQMTRYYQAPVVIFGSR